MNAEKLRSIPLLLALFGLCAVTACTSFTAVSPPGFVELDDQKLYDYRATSADGIVIGVRELENDPRGELEFWARAIENQLRARHGYALLETRAVRSKDGIAGKQFRFGHDEGALPHLYYLTVFVTPKTIQLVEIGGAKERMLAHAKETDFAVANFSVD